MSDKMVHMFISMLLVSIAYVSTEDYVKSFEVALVAGFVKELYDVYSYGLFSIGDMIFNIIGIMIGMFLIAISKKTIEIWLDRHRRL